MSNATSQRKEIKFYRKNSYGVEREYIHPDNQGEAQIISRLTGRAGTIDPIIRGLIRDLSGGSILFTEVLAPR